MKKILVVDHNALEPANRALYKTLAAYNDVSLRLVVPQQWFNNFQMLQFTQPENKPNYELVSSKVVFASRTHRLIYRSLNHHLKEFRPDIFYVNAEPENFQSFHASVVKRSANVKLVFSSWRTVDHRAAGYPYKLAFLHKAIEQFVLNRAAHGIVFNQTAKKLFAKYGFDRTTVIPPPVDTTLFRPAAIKNDGFTIGYVGRLIPEKGIDLILYTLQSLPADCKGMIVGEGEMKGDLVRLSQELGIAERVEFVSPVKPEKLPELFARMSVLVLPSRRKEHWTEQFGRVLVEAMACGIPVIGADSGEIASVIGDAGLVFKEESVEGLRLGIDRLYKSELLRAQMSGRGLDRAKMMFSLEVVAAQYHKLFHAL